MSSVIKSNAHTHTDRVDGKSTAREQIESALSLGFVSLGFTEHAEEPWCGLTPESAEAYIDEINALKAEYAGKLRIWLGIERGRLSTDNRRERYDYILGASHYFTAPGIDAVGIDGDAQGLDDYVNKYLGGSWDAAIKKYFDEYADYICGLKPDIIAHFDLIVKYNRTRRWFDESAGALIEYGRAAMERMIKACSVLEVNTGGMARSNQPCPYPVLPLLSYWRELGGRVIPSSDCHNAGLLDARFDIVCDYMRRAGYVSALRLGTGDTLFEEYEL